MTTPFELPEGEPPAAVFDLWGLIKAYLEDGKTPPRWTVWRKNQALKLYRPWLNGRMQKVLRSFEVLPATWRKYVPAKHWKRASRKRRAPAGLKRLRKRIRMQSRDAASDVMRPKERHTAAWAFGPWLTRTEVERLVAKAQP